MLDECIRFTWVFVYFVRKRWTNCGRQSHNKIEFTCKTTPNIHLMNRTVRISVEIFFWISWATWKWENFNQKILSDKKKSVVQASKNWLPVRNIFRLPHHRNRTRKFPLILQQIQFQHNLICLVIFLAFAYLSHFIHDFFRFCFLSANVWIFSNVCLFVSFAFVCELRISHVSTESFDEIEIWKRYEKIAQSKSTHKYTRERVWVWERKQTEPTK